MVAWYSATMASSGPFFAPAHKLGESARQAGTRARRTEVANAVAGGPAARTYNLGAVVLSLLLAVPLQAALPPAGAGAPRLVGAAVQQHSSAAPMSSCASSRTGLVPSASSLQASWPSYGGNPANTHTAVSSRITAANVAGLRLSWATCIAPPGEVSVRASGFTTTAVGYYLPHTSDQLYITNPVIGGGRVFVEAVFAKTFSNPPAGFAELIALDERTGKLDWARRLGQELNTTGLPVPAFDHGRVFAGDLSHLYAFDASDGALLWKYSSPAPGQPIFPNASGGRVYFARNFYLFALDASTGAVDWTGPLLATPTESAPPAIVGATVVIGDCFGGVQAFSASSGATKWSVRLSDPSQLANVTSPTFGGGNIFVSNGKRLFALDANKGTVVWSHAEHNLAGNPVFVTDLGSVFAPTGAGPWQAYSTATGQERLGFRSVATGADASQAATGSRDVIFFPTALGVLKAIDASTGRTLWTMPGSTLPSPIAGLRDETSSAAVAGSAMAVFVGRSTGAFLALYSLP